jgi:hypothetical protein
MRACQFCGASVEAVEPLAVETPPLPAPDAPAGHTVRIPAAPDSSSESSTAAALPAVAPDDRVTSAAPKKRTLSAVPVLVGLMAVGFLLFVGRRLLVALPGFDQPGASSLGDTAQPSKDAPSSSGPVTAPDLGIDIYPGANPLSDADRRDSTDSTVVSQSFVTSARMDLVIDFYKARMVGQTTIYASGNGVVISIAPGAQESIQIAIAPAASGGQTRIAITHTTVKSTN